MITPGMTENDGENGTLKGTLRSKRNTLSPRQYNPIKGQTGVWKGGGQLVRVLRCAWLICGILQVDIVRHIHILGGVVYPACTTVHA